MTSGSGAGKKVDIRQARLDREAMEFGYVLQERPASIEAEQAVLGGLMFDPTAFSNLPDGFDASSFYEPVHGRMFDSIKEEIEVGAPVDPVFVHEKMRGDEAVKELGGLRYFADLIDRAPPGANVPDYAKLLIHLQMRREVVDAALSLAMTCIDAADPPEDALAVAEQRLTSLRLKSRQHKPVSLAEASLGTLAYVQEDKDAVGIHTGLAPVDRVMGPLLPGDFIVLGGATGSGKSAVACAVAQNVADPYLAAVMNGVDWDPARRPRGVMKFDMEMSFGDGKSGGQVVRRHMADVGFHMHGRKFPTYAAIRAKDVSVDQLRMMQDVHRYLAAMPIMGLSRAGLTMTKMRHVAERQFLAWERDGISPGLIVIDHLGLATVDKPVNRYQDQTQVAIDGKSLARDLGVPVLALAQIVRSVSRRESEDKRPTINDLKDSGELENSADMVVLAYRDSYYAKREKEPDMSRDPAGWGAWDARCRSKEVELIMGKVREGEMGAVAKVWGEVAWNAIRSREPVNGGDLL